MSGRKAVQRTESRKWIVKINCRGGLHTFTWKSLQLKNILRKLSRLKRVISIKMLFSRKHPKIMYKVMYLFVLALYDHILSYLIFFYLIIW